jgi:hypothetical protein
MSREFRRDFLKAGKAMVFGSVANRLLFLGTPKNSEMLLSAGGGMSIAVPGRACQFDEDCPEGSKKILPPGLNAFIKSVKNDSENEIAGVYIEDKLTFPVIKQPDGNPAYVAQWAGATEFNLKAFSVNDDTGLLLESRFVPDTVYDIAKGDRVFLVSGGGSIREYGVTQIRRFLALSPYSPNSVFMELREGGEIGRGIMANMLFREIYSDPDSLDDELVILTCELDKKNVPIIRRFIIAHILGS